jgi:hypothetical protein
MDYFCSLFFFLKKKKSLKQKKIIIFRLTPEQMKRLDDVSQPTELPFPYSFTNQLDISIGKNMQVADRFAPIAIKYNYGRLFH